MQVITRLIANNDKIEILVVDKGREYFKEIEVSEYLDRVSDLLPNIASDKEKDVTYINDDYIALGNNCVVINQPQHKRIVSFDKKTYNVNFPNSIYIVTHANNKIKKIEAYSYKQFNDEKTQLYKYPMPNMLYANLICIGTSPREISNKNYTKALEKIIFTQYTHVNVNDIKSFKSTKDYFDYIEKNDFPYDLLIPLKISLRSVLHYG